MKRISLTDGSGRWFDKSAVKAEYGEETRWDGRNHVSLATGSQWNHEELLLTSTGVWVLHAWSQWQGSKTTYEAVDDQTAAAWLVRNKHEIPRRLSAATKALEI